MQMTREDFNNIIKYTELASTLTSVMKDKNAITLEELTYLRIILADNYKLVNSIFSQKRK